MINRLRLIAISNNLGDAKSLITHPATTTHQRFSAAERTRLPYMPLTWASLAVDHAKEGIRVNAICPGFIMTKMNEDFLGNPPDAQEQLDNIAAQIVPLGYRGEVNDIAYALVYMASDESRYMTGAHLTVDGGWSCY